MLVSVLARQGWGRQAGRDRMCAQAQPGLSRSGERDAPSPQTRLLFMRPAASLAGSMGIRIAKPPVQMKLLTDHVWQKVALCSATGI